MRRKYGLDLGVRARRRGPFPPILEASKEGWSDVERSTLSSRASRVRSTLHFWVVFSSPSPSFLPRSLLSFTALLRARGRTRNGNECTFPRCTVPSPWLQRLTGPEYNHRDFPECVACRIGPLSLSLSLSLRLLREAISLTSRIVLGLRKEERKKSKRSRDPPANSFSQM